MSTDGRFDDTPPHGQQAVLPAPPAEGAEPERVRVTPRRAAHRPQPAGRTFDGSKGLARRSRGHRPRRWALLGALGVIVLAAVGIFAWLQSEATPSGPEGKPVVIDVKPGEATDTVVATLARKGVIDDGFAFRLWSLLYGQPTVRPGRYQLRENSSFSTVHTRLGAGPNVYELHVQAGTTLSEVANQLATLPGDLARTFSRQAKSGEVSSPYQPAPGASLEGLIGTGTYQVTPGESARTLLGEMVARFDAEAASVGLSPGASVDGLSAYDAVTVASIAQKEGYFTRYMGDVARVIYNRLADGMPLDMTSTVLYSLGQDGGPVTPKEEAITSPYNTYLHDGLTPTPICTPSKAALAAAVSPPSGPWLYFELVTAKKGVMVFSATFTGQVAAEQEAAANAAAGKGSTSPSATGAT